MSSFLVSARASGRPRLARMRGPQQLDRITCAGAPRKSAPSCTRRRETSTAMVRAVPDADLPFADGRAAFTADRPGPHRSWRRSRVIATAAHPRPGPAPVLLDERIGS
jgi:hypothetical protein